MKTKGLPIVNIGPATFAVVDIERQEAEDKEKAGHSKADSIYRRIPHQLLTGVTSFNTFTNVFVKRNLRKKREKSC